MNIILTKELIDIPLFSFRQKFFSLVVLILNEQNWVFIICHTIYQDIDISNAHRGIVRVEVIYLV